MRQRLAEVAAAGAYPASPYPHPEEGRGRGGEQAKRYAGKGWVGKDGSEAEEFGRVAQLRNTLIGGKTLSGEDFR